MSTSPAQLRAQLGLEYNPPTPLASGPPCVQGIISLYELGLELRIELREGENFASVDVGLGSIYTLMVRKETDGYSVTAACDGNVKQSFFPPQGRGRYWDTSQ